MTPRLTEEERLDAIERELIQIKARLGTVQLSTPTLSLIWAVMLAALTSVVFVVRLEGKVEAYSRLIAEDHETLDAHVSSPGHQVSLERIDDLRERVMKLEPTKREVR